MEITNEKYAETHWSINEDCTAKWMACPQSEQVLSYKHGPRWYKT